MGGLRRSSGRDRVALSRRLVARDRHPLRGGPAHHPAAGGHRLPVPHRPPRVPAELGAHPPPELPGHEGPPGGVRAAAPAAPAGGGTPGRGLRGRRAAPVDQDVCRAGPPPHRRLQRRRLPVGGVPRHHRHRGRPHPAARRAAQAGRRTDHRHGRRLAGAPHRPLPPALAPGPGRLGRGAVPDGVPGSALVDRPVRPDQAHRPAQHRQRPQPRLRDRLGQPHRAGGGAGPAAGRHADAARQPPPRPG